MDFEPFFKEHDAIIDAAAIDSKYVMSRLSQSFASKNEFRDRLKRGARKAARNALDGWPADYVASILGGRTVQFAQRACEVIKRGKLDQIDDMLFSFYAELCSTVVHEWQHGILKPVTPDTEIDRCRGMLAAKKRNSNEVAGLRALLHDGERIRHVGFRQTQTSERVITREEEWAAMPHDRCVSAEFIQRMRNCGVLGRTTSLPSGCRIK
jgi:hypothetical protein